MPEEHLELPFYEKAFERKKRRGGRLTYRNNLHKFYSSQVSNIGKIKQDFAQEKKKFSKYFNPNLIFKIKLNQAVDEETFMQFLENCGIKVISASPSKKGYWISIAEDEDLEKIQKKLKVHAEKEKFVAFHAIESFEPIPAEEKIGDQLRVHPLKLKEKAYLDIEIWRMEDKRLKSFLKGFEAFLMEKGGKVTDEFSTDNLCLLRVNIVENLFHEIVEIKEISRIDRPPKPYFTSEMLVIPVEKLEIVKPPSKRTTAIAVIDSGVLSNHPLLANSVGDEIAISMLSKGDIKEDKPQDDVGHGTKVAGIAAYGELRQCILNKKFSPKAWILSAKIMYKEENPLTGEVNAVYDESELLEHQLEKAVRYFVGKYDNCKIINLSLGDRYKVMFGNKRQYALATLIDELAYKLGVIFIVSIGNLPFDKSSDFDSYPNYLLEENENVKLIDPSSSAYALTVGSIVQEYGPDNEKKDTIAHSPANKQGYPSPFTRVGPGYKGMIKPDLVEEGGNIITTTHSGVNRGGNLIALNPDWLKDGRLFTGSFGTSLASPKVANLSAQLYNQYPDFSANLIKALVLASAEIPKNRPAPLDQINYNGSDTEMLNLLKVYGHGKPNFQTALFSLPNHVILKSENEIPLNGIHLYYFYLPTDFLTFSGIRQISVSLAYNPPIRRNRIDYMGANMEFHLFKNSILNDIVEGYSSILKNGINTDTEDVIPDKLKVKEIKLTPGVRLRKKGLHQKGIKVYRKIPHGIDADKPLVLAIVNQDRWIKDTKYKQNYAVVVTVKHSAEINLYNQIKQRITEKIRIRT
jgi:hypothetical protein